MGNIIAQTAPTGRMDKQASAVEKSSGAESFPAEMDKAVKKGSDSKAIAAEAAEVAEVAGDRASVEQSDNAGRNVSEDVKGTVAEDNAAAIVQAIPMAIFGNADNNAAPAGLSTAGEHSAAGIRAAVAVEGAEPAEAVPADGATVKSMSEKTLSHKQIDTERLPGAELLFEDVKETLEIVEAAKGDVGATEEGANDKGLKAGLAANPGAQSAADSDNAAEPQEAKGTASAAATPAGQGDESFGGTPGENGRDDKGHHNNAGQRTGVVLSISQFSRQAASYEAVASGAGLSGAERAEVYEKLSTGVSMSVARDGNEVKLLLRPDHLGNLSIKLNIEDGKVNARIVVESASIKEALDADSGTLREVFTKSNLVLDRYSVVIADSGVSDHADFKSFSGFSGFEKDTREGSLPGGVRAANAMDEPCATTAPATAVRPSGIDLFI